LAWVGEDDDRYLDLIHATILTADTDWATRDRLLAVGGSAWTATEQGLRRRVDPAAHLVYVTATGPEDDASDELTEAWANAFGREPTRPMLGTTRSRPSRPC
jgi:hypothetical protein